MASEHHVKQYLSYWFQLGKPLLIHNGQQAILPSPVIQGSGYSQEFEKCWEAATAKEAGDCYLEGTTNTIAELLTPAWDVSPCARCCMPVPMKTFGVPTLDCPCIDLPGWPHLTVPQPRAPINSQEQLIRIRDRLRSRKSTD